MQRLDIRQTPFSRYGSYMALAYLEREGLPLGPGLYLRSLHGMGVVRPELFRITWSNGDWPTALIQD